MSDDVMRRNGQVREDHDPVFSVYYYDTRSRRQDKDFEVAFDELCDFSVFLEPDAVHPSDKFLNTFRYRHF